MSSRRRSNPKRGLTMMEFKPADNVETYECVGCSRKLYKGANDYFKLACDENHTFCGFCFAGIVAESGCSNKLKCPCCSQKTRDFSVVQSDINLDIDQLAFEAPKKSYIHKVEEREFKTKEEDPQLDSIRRFITKYQDLDSRHVFHLSMVSSFYDDELDEINFE